MGHSIILFAIIAAFLVGFVAGDWGKSNKIENQKQEIEIITKHWDSKSGFTTTYLGETGGLSYNLRSFDDGKHWYKVEYNEKDSGWHILGEVETLHPGLLEHLESWDKIMSKKSLNINSVNSPDAELLRNVGFDVIETAPKD